MLFETDDDDLTVMLKFAFLIRVKSCEAHKSINLRLKELADRNIFINGFDSLQRITEIGKKCDELEINELEKYLINNIKMDFEFYSEMILNKFPDRNFSLMPALNAHKRGEYILSMPIFFAEADGIMKRTLGVELFTKKNGITEFSKETYQKIEKKLLEIGFEFSLIRNHFELFYEVLNISLGEAGRTKINYDELNRNIIMHGLYDKKHINEENSIKAFSFLLAVSSMMINIKEKITLLKGV